MCHGEWQAVCPGLAARQCLGRVKLKKTQSHQNKDLEILLLLLRATYHTCGDKSNTCVRVHTENNMCEISAQAIVSPTLTLRKHNPCNYRKTGLGSAGQWVALVLDLVSVLINILLGVLYVYAWVLSKRRVKKGRFRREMEAQFYTEKAAQQYPTFNLSLQ